MKEIVAIIRPKKMSKTKHALEEAGFPSMTASQVTGRGHQRGIAGEMNFNLSTDLLIKGRLSGMKYIPKRMLTIVVHDDEVDTVVKTIIKMNQTAVIGDGKIFICPMEDAFRVRTDERGEDAV
jgi:nitrogen regulatory protein PII 2